MIKKSRCTWWLQYSSQVHTDFLITLYNYHVGSGMESNPFLSCTCTLFKEALRCNVLWCRCLMKMKWVPILCGVTRDRAKQKYSSAINVTHMAKVSNPDFCGDKPHYWRWPSHVHFNCNSPFLPREPSQLTFHTHFHMTRTVTGNGNCSHYVSRS